MVHEYVVVDSAVLHDYVELDTDAVLQQAEVGTVVRHGRVGLNSGPVPEGVEEDTAVLPNSVELDCDTVLA